MTLELNYTINLYTGLLLTHEEIFQVLSVIMTGTGDFIVHLYSRINNVYQGNLLVIKYERLK